MNAPPTVLLDARYRLGPVIARGGMSTVHRGTDTRLDRPVAIKVMEPRLAADPAFRTRFEREARSAARIDHPAVVDVYDQGDDRQGPEPVVFLVMELVEGGTLRDVLRLRGQLGVPAAIAVMDRVLAGLAQAHRLGLVHRDIKPENVLIGYGGEVKVADFGLAVAAAKAGASHVGMIMGTVAYLSPEQVATGSADARSDVYSAGVLLYELLTGTPPYVGDTAISVAFRHVNDRVPAPSLIAGDVPPELDALLARATDRDPAARPADAADLLDRLRRVAVTLEVPRVPVPVPHRPTAPEATGPDAMAPGPRGTRALPAGAPARDTTAGLPDLESGHRRTPAPGTAGWPGRRGIGVVIALVLVVALLVAAGVWWLTAGRWTAVPSLLGVQQAAAEQLLDGSDLERGAVTPVLDDVVPAGVVLDVDPDPGARLLRGETVSMTVSGGRPVVPTIVEGTGLAAAEEAVRAAGLTPARRSSAGEFSDTVPAGAVVRTDPEPGTALEIGADVTLVVSRGVQPPPEPEEVRVPLVLGRDAASAAEILAEAGFAVRERNRLPFLSRENATVVSQSPGAGALVEVGTTIVIDTL